MSYRVIQWGTGAVGVETLAATLDDRPDLELVGVRVYSDAKDGADVGELLGRAPIGVRATTDVQTILDLEADCVVYTPRITNLDDVCALLAGGKNVVTTAIGVSTGINLRRAGPSPGSGHHRNEHGR